jgi:hypothetical protein
MRAFAEWTQHDLVTVGHGIGNSLVRFQEIVFGQPQREARRGDTVGRQVGNRLAVNREPHRGHAGISKAPSAMSTALLAHACNSASSRPKNGGGSTVEHSDPKTGKHPLLPGSGDDQVRNAESL